MRRSSDYSTRWKTLHNVHPYSRRAGPRIALASTFDFESFEKHGLIGPDRDDKDCVIFPERIAGKIALLHRLESKIQIAYFDSISDLQKSKDFWKSYGEHLNDYEVIRSKFPWEQERLASDPHRSRQIVDGWSSTMA